MRVTTTDRRRLIAVAAAVTLLIVAVIVALVVNRGTTETPRPAAAPAAAETFSFFAGDDITGVQTTQEEAPVEIGLRFSSRSDGVLSAVRFLRAHNDSSSHPVTVWSVRGGKKLAGATSSATLTGWQDVPLSSPVPIKAGEQYVVSYQADRYRASTGFFRKPAQAGPLSAVADAGVFAYDKGTLPALSYQASNYWVDVVFQPAAAASAAAPGAATPSSGAAAAAALSLPRIPWEGGPSYYKSFAPARNSGWDKDSFFPVAVWYEGVGRQQEVDLDKKMGLNTYIMLTGDSDLELIRRNGMSAMIAEDHKDRGDESVGWVLADEADMWGGAGDGRWTGKWPGQGEVCTPKGSGCGKDIQATLHGKLPKDGRMAYANYGKGVMFWQSDADAAKLVNSYSAVVSNDIYWYTDGNVCRADHEGRVLGVKEEFCRRAANYGLTVDRMRTLDAADGKRQPVFNFVEVSHPGSDAALPTITGEQLAGAVMSSLIHEARGIIYFNHNFGGPCVSQHVLREKCGDAVRPAVTEVNRRITRLAPVLNTQSYQWTFNPALDTMLKAHDGSYYIFAMPGREGGTGEQTLALPPGLTGARAEVMFENRTVPITGGHLRDTFGSESSYHIYRVVP
ncbi:DUF4082 domain-containing protein [Actinoplanes sp. M2I2]|uniref:DUF4082 domain-containing protein n=1 Tax=Actinoplanes sp. M2I2 TaxID=1734444 RepID=UPI002021603F|nr:DUF4082 domain-containing protein [Actinoplanes sp. M2I2]